MTLRRSSWCFPFLLLAIGATSSVRAQTAQRIDFSLPKSPALVVPPMSDTQLAFFMDGLDAELGAMTPARWQHDADGAIEEFVERLQANTLSGPQQQRVLGYLDGLAKAHPAAQPMILEKRHVVSSLLVGETAPDIQGPDLDGQAFRLSEYRGKVVVLTFWGDWCGACHADFPYDRLLLQLYHDRPFAAVSVNSDASESVARGAAAGVTSRAWWDGGSGAAPTHGRIAQAWDVTAWPTTYVIDATGVIRFVNLRQEDLLKAVKQLVTEQMTEEAQNR